MLKVDPEIRNKPSLETKRSREEEYGLRIVFMTDIIDSQCLSLFLDEDIAGVSACMMDG